MTIEAVRLRFYWESPDLQYLDLAYCRRLDSVNFLKKLRNLRHLDLSGCKRLASLNAVADLPLLQHLDLRDCTELRSFAPVKSLLGHIDELYLSGCCFDALDPMLYEKFLDIVANHVRTHFAIPVRK